MTKIFNLLSASVTALFLIGPASSFAATSDPVAFSPLKMFDDFLLSIDLASIAIKDQDKNPRVAADIEVRAKLPVKIIGVDKPILSFVYTVEADCTSKSLVVIVSRLFDEHNVLAKSITSNLKIVNPKASTTPAALVLDLLCSPFEKTPIERWDRYKGFEQKDSVTGGIVPKS